jgi:hypothetical protein
MEGRQKGRKEGKKERGRKKICMYTHTHICIYVPSKQRRRDIYTYIIYVFHATHTHACVYQKRKKGGEEEEKKNRRAAGA